MRTDGIDRIHRETLIVFHKLFFLASLYGFPDRVFQLYSIFIGGGKKGDEFFATLQRHLHFAAHSLGELLQHLEGLVKACRCDGDGIIFLLAVETSLEMTADFHSRTMLMIREPFTPIQAPIGSILSS